MSKTIRSTPSTTTTHADGGNKSSVSTPEMNKSITVKFKTSKAAKQFQLVPQQIETSPNLTSRQQSMVNGCRQNTEGEEIPSHSNEDNEDFDEENNEDTDDDENNNNDEDTDDDENNNIDEGNGYDENNDNDEVTDDDENNDNDEVTIDDENNNNDEGNGDDCNKDDNDSAELDTDFAAVKCSSNTKSRRCFDLSYPSTKYASPRDSNSSGSRSKSPSFRNGRKNNIHIDAKRKKKISESDSSESGSESNQQPVTTGSRQNGIPNTKRKVTDEEKHMGVDGQESVLPDESNSDLEDDGQAAFVLCVPAVSTLSHELRLAITREVFRDAGPVVSIRMWHDLHPNVPRHERQIIFLIKDLAQCIQSKEVEQLKLFLFSSKYFEQKVHEYEIGIKALNELDNPELVDRYFINKLLSASEMMEASNGSILTVGECTVLKTHINDALDQDGTIRAKWPAVKDMICWSAVTKLSSEPSTMESIHCEERRLEKWLTNLDPPLSLVGVHPQESVFRLSEQNTDLVERLRKKTDNARAAVGSTLLVFQRVDTEVVHFDRYFKKVLETMDSTQLSNQVVLLPTAHVKSKAQRAAVVSLLPGNLQPHVKVLTALDPAFMPCTWIALQFLEIN
ncbi:putative mediator of RNA polymerase II transcription subunit 24 isoform X2 [Gigantopelta aegis]|uniref:putative mediator of RNA polymerase II transcription subunit 24 isoform X2 n=1 Tax=Gigantopelta aegis TaxID=1735272 RepID=UPI001B88AAE1|nr:putative mediator of RNA polymerase II transcription subunit 24 isoform X2 [Gigantopelta aegis]